VIFWLRGELSGKYLYFFKPLSRNYGLKKVSMSIYSIFKVKSNTKLRLEIVVNILFLHLKSNRYCLKTKHFFLASGLINMMYTKKKDKTLSK